MGRKAGIILSAAGLALLVMALILVLTVSSAIMNPPSGLGALAVIGLVGVGLVVAGGIWIIACVLYAIAYLTTKRMEDRIVGVMFEAGGVLHFIFLINSVMLISRSLSGPLTENASIVVLFLILPVVAGALLVAGGIRRL